MILHRPGSATVRAVGISAIVRAVSGRRVLIGWETATAPSPGVLEVSG